MLKMNDVHIVWEHLQHIVKSVQVLQQQTTSTLEKQSVIVEWSEMEDKPSDISNLTEEQVKELSEMFCLEAYGFEGHSTFPPCDTCLICVCKKKIND